MKYEPSLPVLTVIFHFQQYSQTIIFSFNHYYFLCCVD